MRIFSFCMFHFSLLSLNLLYNTSLFSKENAAIKDVLISYQDWNEIILANLEGIPSPQKEELLKFYQENLSQEKAFFVAREKDNRKILTPNIAIALILGIESYWEEVILTDCLTEGLNHFYSDTNILLTLTSMPKPWRKKVANKILKNYHKLKSGNWKHGFGLAPKRCADLFLKALDRPFAVFIEQNQVDSTRLFQNFLDDQRSRFEEQKEVGNYGFSEIIPVVESLRDLLSSGILCFDENRVKTIVLGGSFPNGKAKLTFSDLDLILADERGFPIKTRKFLEIYLDVKEEMQKECQQQNGKGLRCKNYFLELFALKNSLKKMGEHEKIPLLNKTAKEINQKLSQSLNLRVKLKVQIENANYAETSFFGVLNSFSLLIGENSTKLFVYDLSHKRHEYELNL